jgi:hypothetical protein
MAFALKSNKNVRKGATYVPGLVHLSRATAALPASTAAALFNVVGGRVEVHRLLGEVTTVIQTQANATKIKNNPTAGTTADVTATLDITADEVGTLYMVEGDGTALVGVNAGTGVQAVTVPWVAPVGDIELDCAATNTGAIKWDIWYRPLDEGAYVTAA